MRRLFAFILGLILCLQILVGPGSSTTALSDGENQTSSGYTNDFSSDTISDFTVTGPDNGAWGTWNVTDGKLRVTGNQGAKWWGTTALLRDRIFSDFVMEFDADAISGYGVIIRIGAPEALGSWYGGDAYAIMHWNPAENWASSDVRLFNGSGSQGGTLLKSAGALHKASSVHWKIEAAGNTVSYTITDNADSGNTLSCTLEDSTYSAGYIGFYNLTAAGVTSLKIDNLTITSTAPDAPQIPDVDYTVTEPEAQISWDDDMSSGKGENYTPYGLWWNDAVSSMTGADYSGVLGNEGGKSDGYTYYYLDGYKFSDFVMEFDVVSAAEKAQYGVMLRASDPGPGTNQGNGYTVMYDGKWVFAGKMNGSFTQITRTPSRHVYNPAEHGVTLTHWKVVCSGGNIAVYFNGSDEPAIHVYDETYTKGQVGLRAFAPAGVTGSLIIDNLRVWGVGDKDGDDTPDEPFVPEPDNPVTVNVKEPEAKISWKDDMNSDRGGSYTPYGLWWNDSVSAMTGTDYRGVLGNEGGSVSGYVYYYLNGYTFEDLVMEFDVVSASKEAQYGVVLRAGKPGPGADEGNGYTVMHDGKWVFAGKIDGSFTQITETPHIASYNPAAQGLTITHWKVVCVGNNILVYFNGSDDPAIWVKDSTYTKGQVGLRAFAPKNTVNNVVIDNLTVKGTGTYTKPKPKGLSIRSYDLDTYDFEWNDSFDTSTFTSYLAYGRWWNNAPSETNGTDYSGIVANEGGIGDGICYYYLRRYKWADFTMEFDVSNVDKSAQYGVVLRAGKATPGADDCDGYTIMYDGDWIFVGRLDGKFNQIKSDVSAYAYNPKDNGIRPKHWKVVCRGNLIELYLNHSDKAVIRVTDNAFKCGFVGFRTFAKMGEQTNAIFDNLKIRGTVLHEELTTRMNSNRRSGELKDYSQLTLYEKRANKVIEEAAASTVPEPVSEPASDPAAEQVSQAPADEQGGGSSAPGFLLPAVIGVIALAAGAEVFFLIRKRRRDSKNQ